MKKTILSIIALLILLLVPSMVFAAEEPVVAKVGTETFTTIENALNYAMENGGEVVLQNDVTLSGTYQVTEDLTINLAGFNISATNKLFEVTGAEFTVTGKGTLQETTPDYAPIRVYGTSDENTVVNVGSEVTLKGWAGIMITFKGEKQAHNVTINCNGTILAQKDSAGDSGIGIYMNGSIKDTENYPVINLSSTTKIDANPGFGIYAAGFAEWNINGSTINGTGAAIGMKSGIMVLNDAIVTATGDFAEPVGNGNGINSTGAAIQVEEYKSYAGKIDLTINGGTYTSENNSALLEYTTSVDGVTFIEEIEINDGIFTSAEGKQAITVSDSFKETITDGFIKGGTFSTDVSQFLPEYYVCNVSDSNYVVQKLHNITVNVKDSVGGTASSDLIRAVEGTTIGLFINPDTGYELKEVIITDVLGVQTKTTNQYFTMPNSDVIVEVVFSKVLKQEVQIPDVVEDAEKVENILLESLKENVAFQEVIKNNNVEVKVELSEDKVETTEKEEIKEKLEERELTVAKCFDITIAVKNKDTGVTVGTLDVLKEKIKFTIAIPEDLPEVAEGFDRIYYIVRNHVGEVEYLEVELSEDGKFISFETDKFSTYALAYTDVETTGSVAGETEKEETKEEETKEEETKTEETKTEETKAEESTSTENIPNTGDNIALYILLAVIAIAGIIVMKKVNTTKSKHQ